MLLKLSKVGKQLKINIFLSIICILVICKCSSIPNLFSNLTIFNMPLEGTSEFKILKILENFSFAYLTSFMFYLIVDFIPKCKREYTSFKLIEDDLISIYMYMDIIINYFKYKFNFNDIKGLSNEKIKEIDDFCFNSQSEYLVAISLRDDIEEGEVTKLFNARKECICNGKGLDNNLKKILKIIMMNKIDDDLCVILNKICNCGFLQKLTKFIPSEVNIKGLEIENRYLNFYKDLAEFIFLHNEIKKYRFLKLGTIFKKANEKQIDEYNKYQNDIIQNNPDILKYIQTINKK